MFAYPEEPLNRNKWKMRKILSLDDSLKLIQYPDPSSVQVDAVETIYTLPDYVYTSESDEIKVGVWDDQT